MIKGHLLTGRRIGRFAPRILPAAIILGLLLAGLPQATRPALADLHLNAFIVNTEDPYCNDAATGDGVCDCTPDTTPTCSLYAAIQEANARPGADVITFAPDVVEIILIRDLPTLSDPTGGTTIKGHNVKVWGPFVQGFALGSNGNKIQGLDIAMFDTCIDVWGDGNAIGADGDGVDDENEYNYIHDCTMVGVSIHDGDDNKVAGNLIGLLGPIGRSGIEIMNTSENNLVGTEGDGYGDDVEKNVVGYCGECGIRVQGNNNVIAGNHVGADFVGTAAVPNGTGICLENGAQGNRIGTDANELGDPFERNVISGNDTTGVTLYDAHDNVIAGNYIGVGTTGLMLPNGDYGLYLIQGASQNRIGSNLDGVWDDQEGNWIWGAGIAGVMIVGAETSDNKIQGNTIEGSGQDGISIGSSVRNPIRRNSLKYNGSAFYAAGNLGIDLGANGVTPNDNGDGDLGANMLQNYPYLAGVSQAGSGDFTLLGELNSWPYGLYTVEFFSSGSCHPSGYGEGVYYLGSLAVAADASGHAAIETTFPWGTTLSPGMGVSATATDAYGNTSEFSNCAVAQASPPGGTHQVNSTADAVDANTGDGVCETAAGNGVCTLRAAVQQANASSGPDVILLPAGAYTITRGGDDDTAVNGDLDITGAVEIVGAGAATTIVDGGGLDRVFHVMAPPLEPVTISGLTIQNGDAATGCGLHNRSDLSLTGAVVRHNGGGMGAGIYNDSDGQLTLLNSTVHDNQAPNERKGGGIYNKGMMEITNSTISANRAEGSGGGIYVESGDLYLASATLTLNTADEDADGGDGGGIYNAAGAVRVRNTIIGQNVDNSPGAYPNGAADCSGTFITQEYNLITDRAYDGATQACNGFTGAGDQVGGDFAGSLYLTLYAGLGPLQDNGGPTPTHMPLPPVFIVIDRASPATPGGGDPYACPATDQRGQARPVDGDGDGTPRCDKGAVEYFVPGLSIGDASVAEGGLASFTIYLYPPAEYTATVDYATEDGSAIAGSDYTATAGQAILPPGATETTITVQTLNDSLSESSETFLVNLSNAHHADIANGRGIGVITDNDPLPGISIGDVTVTGGAGGSRDVAFTVSLSAASGRQVAVSYATADGTAIAGSDYVARSGRIFLDAGQTSATILISILGDMLIEGDEYFYVNLSSPSGGSLVDGQGRCVVEDPYLVLLPVVTRSH